MAHCWALSKAEDVVLWRKGKGVSETDRQTSHVIARMALPKVTTRRLCDSCPEAGRALGGMLPSACCTFSMA